MPSQTFERDWRDILDSFDQERVEHMSEIAQQYAQDFATTFYTTLMADSQAQHFLNHQQVKSRLHDSLQDWIRQMCDTESRASIGTIYARQSKVGEVHARTGVPVSIVLKGARLLKREFEQKTMLYDEPLEKRLQCIQLFGRLMDLSMEAMSEAYATSIDQKTRSSEAYRLFSLTENLAT